MAFNKVLLGSAFAVVAFASSAHALTADSDSLEIVLNGEVPSQCELVPDGPLTRTINMDKTSAQLVQPVVGWIYGCNSPYNLTIQSQYGRMENLTSMGAHGVDYKLKIVGSGGTQTVEASDIKSTPVSIDSATSWSHNFGAQAVANLDLEFPGIEALSKGVAGTYTDTLTVTLTAAF